MQEKIGSAAIGKRCQKIKSFLFNIPTVFVSQNNELKRQSKKG